MAMATLPKALPFPWPLPLYGRFTRAVNPDRSSRYITTGGVKGSHKLDISGIFPPIPTPFTAHGLQIDYAALRNNFSHWNQIPFAGYVVMGSNGEAVSLSDKERLELLRSCKELAKPGSKIIAGLGLPTSLATVELCNKVWAEGTADAGLIITPSFYKGQMTGKALEAFYQEVAEGSKLPIILYSVPGNTGLDLSLQVVTALASHPNCVGLKDSGGDISKIGEILHSTREMDFQVLAGSASFLLPALLMGSVGGICALANVLGDEVCQLYQLFQQKRMVEAVELQGRLIRPNMTVTREHGVPGLKVAMDLTGRLVGGAVRSPLLPLEMKEVSLVESSFAKSSFPFPSPSGSSRLTIET